jgi:hypothetical protein
MTQRHGRGVRFVWLAGSVVLVAAGCTDASSAAVESTSLSPTVDGGGSVELTFNSPTEVEVGAERELARWTIENRSGKSVSLWTDVAIDGLPGQCTLDDVYRWEEIRSLVDSGTPPDESRYNLDPAGEGSGFGVTAKRRDIGESCAGDYELVLIAVSPELADGVAQARVPLTIQPAD